MSEQAAPRVLMISQRHVNQLLFRHSAYEFEDVIRAVDDVDLVAPEHARKDSDLSGKVFNRLGRMTGLHIKRRPSAVPPPCFEHEYELLFVTGTGPEDLLDPDVRHWVETARKRCRRAVFYVEEIWENWLQYENLVSVLRQFDQILLACANTCEAAEKGTGVPVTYLSPGVDMLRFCPLPNLPPRAIDVRSMGRRSAATHESLYAWSEHTGATYLYDSTGNTRGHLGIHRDLCAGLVKRSRYFLVNPAKINRDDHTGGQEEVGLRFYEGAGGGAVLLGQRPKCKAYDDNFDWPDAVIEMPYGSADAPDIIAELDRQPERLARIRRDNVYHHLRRHDWVYRWLLALEALGLEPRPRAHARVKRLNHLAAELPLDGLTTNATELERYYLGQLPRPAPIR